MAAPGAAAPDETNLSCRIMAEQRSGDEVCALKQAGINSESRQQGGAETVVNHLHQCRKARRLEALGETPVGETADCKRVIAQAVTVLQQQQVLAPYAICGICRRSTAGLQDIELGMVSQRISER